MQKKLMLLALLAFSFGTTYAQYPQLTPAAKARVDSMQKAWAKHQAEVWAKAEPIVKKGVFISVRDLPSCAVAFSPV